ncbi:AAA family ATPase [Chromobacterium violaceum]|uniref:AAA family ATPase n=1 Tax=Chromobacterium violaceum TaxID=536 RepID=UPI001B33155E|nr:AAA family ATPase [Chromobacterium violaceum]MBP4048777.1 AAA family ATPase [Chromobacterium violaceum]
MKLDISIRDVQRVRSIDFSVELGGESLVCIAGRNGTGKTTLIKAIRNLINSDTFYRTSPERSFSVNSEIRYVVDESDIVFKYDSSKKIIDTKDLIPSHLRRQLYVELPIPYGERFNFFQKISEIDGDLRSSVILSKYSKPTELINFLNSIYATEKFNDLVEIRLRKDSYYVMLFGDNYYLREDYFSSGEYFLISLYRRIVSGYIAIFVDEIDISLDAAAQVKLVEWLRTFKKKYKTTFVFTTHSLAMMRTLSVDELFYMEEQADGSVSIEKRSYAFVKSTLFGFSGWDRYILTEDAVLKDFLDYFIGKYCKASFYQHKIIFVGGGTNTTDLMRRNEDEKFFSKDRNSVITVLDGDQRNKPHSKMHGVYCIPMDSVEKELLARCLRKEFWDFNKLTRLIDDSDRLIDFLDKKNNSDGNKLKALFYRVMLFFRKSTLTRRKLSVANGEPAKDKDFKKAGKRLYQHLISSREFAKNDIFEYLIKKNPEGVEQLRIELEKFICHEI